jgi:hypothetical protein
LDSGASKVKGRVIYHSGESVSPFHWINALKKAVKDFFQQFARELRLREALSGGMLQSGRLNTTGKWRFDGREWLEGGHSSQIYGSV